MRVFALTLGFFLLVLVKIHCQKYNGPGHKRTNGLHGEVVQLKMELQQLKQGNKQLKRQLHHVTECLKDFLQEKDLLKLSETLRKAESKSSVSECAPLKTDTETNDQFNNIYSRSDVERSTNLTLEFQSVKEVLDRMIVLDSAMRGHMLSTRSQMDIFASSASETGKNVTAELTEIKTVLKEVVQDIQSARSEMKRVTDSSNGITNHVLSVKSELTQFQGLLNQTVQKMLSTKSVMKTLRTSLSDVSIYRRCPIGFIVHGVSCYYFSSIQLVFEDAKSSCGHYGSGLAVVTTKDENDFLMEYVREYGKEEHYFLGGTDSSVEGNWKWTSGTSFVYTNWFRGEPNNRVPEEDCLVMAEYYGYLWNDVKCDIKSNYICEYPL